VPQIRSLADIVHFKYSHTYTYLLTSEAMRNGVLSLSGRKSVFLTTADE